MSTPRPTDRRFMQALIRHPEVMVGGVQDGAAWLTQASYGRMMRCHFEDEHPDMIETGADLGVLKLTGRERDAWLWGYRWREPKEEAEHAQSEA